MKRTGHIVFLAAVFLIFLGSCAAKPEQALTGEWKEASGKETISFQKDGTFSGVLIWDMTKGPIAVNGTYTIKGDALTLKPERKTHDLAPMTCKVAFSNSGKELTITYVQGGSIKLDGSVIQYRKVA